MRTLTTLPELNEYFRGISHRLYDHGAHWRPVVQTLAVELQAELAPDTPLHVRTYGNGLGNQIRFTLRNGRELKVSYHGVQKRISVRDAETNRTLHIYGANADIEQVAQDCRQLARRQRERLRPAA